MSNAIIKQAIVDRLEYEEWKLEQIETGLADIKAGRVYSTDEIYKKLGMLKHGRNANTAHLESEAESFQ